MITVTNLLIIGVVLLAALLVYAWREGKKYGTSTREEFVGICTSAYDQTLKKQSNLDTVLALLRQRGELTNADIQKELSVSSRTAVRYMDQLEREGMVAQVGFTGKAVKYRLV